MWPRSAQLTLDQVPAWFGHMCETERMVDHWRGSISELRTWYLVAEDPDLTTALKLARSELDETASVYVFMNDEREFVLVEGGQSFEIQRTGQRNELGEEILVLNEATAPVAITDDLIAERRRVHKSGPEFMREAAARRVVVSPGIRGDVIPEVVQKYLEKSVDVQRQWIALEATTDEWNEFFEAMQAMPEPEQSFIWTFYVMRPHSEVVYRRHPKRPPRGAA
jgi:hypothetical protein